MLAFERTESRYLYTKLGFFDVTQANEFTIVPVNKFIPASPPCKTPSDCSTCFGCGKVAIPYSFDSTPWAHIPAVSTERFAFWITNPSMAMFYAVSRRCQGLQGELASIPESSYQSIQVWRFDPYELCPIGNNGLRQCPQDSSATSRVLPGFVSGDLSSAVCNQSFYVLAPTISYIDEDNLAIEVLETTFGNLNTLTLRPIDSSNARSVERDKWYRLLFVIHSRLSF